MSRSGSSAVRAEASWPAHRPGSGPGGGARSLGLAGADRADAVRPDTALRRLVDLVLAGAGLLVCSPLIAAIGGQRDFSSLTFTINKSKFLYGDFLNLLISFLLIAAVVYFLVVLPFSKLVERFKPTPSEPTPVQDCPYCLSSIPQAAVVCAFCTRDVMVMPGEAARHSRI